MNVEIKSAFVRNEVNVNGANEYGAIAYYVYVMDMANANDVANVLDVTL